MKHLKMDYYLDGFNVEQISCWDLSLACASGYFERENYFYYCFLHTLYQNWNMCHGDISQNVLNVLGIKKHEKGIKDEKDLIETIYESIDRGCPILLVARYNDVFFDSLYKKGTKGRHCFLISGYDKEQEIVILKDYLITKEFVRVALEKDVGAFIDFRITNAQLINIWKTGVENGLNKVFILSKEQTPKIRKYEDIIKFYLSNKYTREYYKAVYNGMLGCDLNVIRRRLYQSNTMFWKIIVKSFDDEYCDLSPVERDDLQQKVHMLLEKRNVLTNKVIKKIIKEDMNMQEVVGNLIKNDEAFYELVQRTYSQAEFKKDVMWNPQKSLSLYARVMCDSEKGDAIADNAVNGTIRNDFDCWLSTYEYPEHWLIVDLGDEKWVNTFVVKHHPGKIQLVTKRFRIEASHDLRNWSVLESIEDNKKHQNVITISSAKFRYFRLYIEKANAINENAARIFSFEIY